MTNSSPSICLNMIVKNESKIIERLLKSTLPIIDCYCICDTGSSDNTKEIITKFFNKHNIPGKIIDCAFINFSYNRNFALNSCKDMSDYILLLDADMLLTIPPKSNFKKTNIVLDSYKLLQKTSNLHYNNVRIVRNNGKYKYIGVTHEYICSSIPEQCDTIEQEDIFITDIGDGGSKTDKFERDITLLTQGIRNEPNNPRYYFYLANSYYDSCKYEKCIPIYISRIKLKGWIQEVWYSYYRIGLAYMNLNKPEEAICSWLTGYNSMPTRIENLYEIIKYYRLQENYNLCNLFYNIAKQIIQSNKNIQQHLFLSYDVYLYKLDYEYSIFSFYMNNKNISNEIVTVLNNCNEKNKKGVLFSNMKFYKDVLKPIKVIDFCDTFTKEYLGQERKFYSSSPSIVKNKDDTYVMNVRYVNYTIDKLGNYKNCDDYIITINKRLLLDSSFNVKDEMLYTSKKQDGMYVGLEDVRLFKPCASSDKIHFFSTKLSKKKQLCVSYGIYDDSVEDLTTHDIEPDFIKTTCEKNWVFVEIKNKGTKIIYSWNPLRICNLDENSNQLQIDRVMSGVPNIFKYMRGSSNGVLVDNEIWFIVHIVSYESPRHYYHCLVVFDDEMQRLVNYSAPFKLEDDRIEYCLSFIVNNGKVYIPYSVMDRSSKIAEYDKKYLREKACFV